MVCRLAACIVFLAYLIPARCCSVAGSEVVGAETTRAQVMQPVDREYSAQVYPEAGLSRRDRVPNRIARHAPIKPQAKFLFILRHRVRIRLPEPLTVGGSIRAISSLN